MKSKNSNVFNFSVVSDIHLGNKRNKTSDIINNLNREFTDDAKMAELDMLVICGDIFDSLLSSVDVLEIDVWISRLLRLCKKHDVALRVLEGTKSHDWYQSSRFESVNGQVGNIGADIVYFRDLTIWYEEKFDMNFLFVPDEWSPTSDQTLHQIKDLLKTKRLEKVDYAFMHGNFDFQFGIDPNKSKLGSNIFKPGSYHESFEYLELVKNLIFIGHIHTYSNFDRIYAQGSFDRMSHNEEEAKGYLNVKAYNDGHHEVIFIENKNAKIFKTINCGNLTLEETYLELEKSAGDLPHGSYVRLRGEYKHPIFTNMDIVLKKYPNCIWTKDPVNKDNVSSDEKYTMISISEYTPVEITPANIKPLLIEKINKESPTNEIMERINYHLNEMIKQV